MIQESAMNGSSLNLQGSYLTMATGDVDRTGPRTPLIIYPCAISGLSNEASTISVAYMPFGVQTQVIRSAEAAFAVAALERL